MSTQSQLKSKTCPTCQKEFQPKSNRQLLCEECREVVNKETKPRRRARRLLELESFPSVFVEVFLKIARGELRLKKEEIRVNTETFRLAKKYYSLFLQFKNQLKIHSEEERKKGRKELADSLESDYKSLSAWELVPRTKDNKAIPGEKKEWMEEAVLIFRRKYSTKEEINLMKNFLNGVELEEEEREEAENPMEDWLEGE